MSLEPGRTVSHYQLVEKLGQGGMGEVYKGLDTRLNRHVAIKVLRTDKGPSGQLRQRFLQEARAASALNHPNIVAIYDIFTEDGADFMVMEFVSGQTLGQAIPKGGLRVSQALALAVQIADALSTAHEAGIVHRDLKPGNVMVTPAGTAKLLDFGLAKLMQPQLAETDETATELNAPLTTVGTVMGTARYMSPEQAEGIAVDARSDVFTFAVVLYEMLTGQCAFQAATTMSTLAAVIRDEPRSVSELTRDIPPALEELIHKAMRKDPQARFQTMRELHGQIVEVQRNWESAIQTGPQIAPASVAAPARPAVQKGGIKVWAGAAGLMAAVAGLAAFLWMNHPAKAPPAEAPPQPASAAETPAAPEPAPVPAPAAADVPKPQAAAPARTASKRQPAATPAPQPVPSAPAEPTGAIPAPPKPPPPVVYGASLADGAPIALVLEQDISADTGDGDPVSLSVAADVRIGDLLVIEKGAKAKAVIAEGSRKKFLRRSKPTMFMETVEAVDGKQVRIREQPVQRAAKDRKAIDVEPADKNQRSKNKDVAAPKGASYRAYIDGTVLIQARKTATH